jgi:hypothetical protein
MKNFIKKPSIKEHKGKINWNKLRRKSGNEYNFIARIVHDGKKKFGKMYFSKYFRERFNNFLNIELFVSEDNKYLGIKFFKEATRYSFKISTGTKRLDAINSCLLKKIEPRGYNEEDIEMDIDNQIIILPIKVKNKFSYDDYSTDFKYEKIIQEELTSAMSGSTKEEGK